MNIFNPIFKVTRSNLKDYYIYKSTDNIIGFGYYRLSLENDIPNICEVKPFKQVLLSTEIPGFKKYIITVTIDVIYEGGGFIIGTSLDNPLYGFNMEGHGDDVYENGYVHIIDKSLLIVEDMYTKSNLEYIYEL